MSRFKFDPKKHVYTLDDKPLMGVTSVLSKWDKGGLVQWSANQAVDYIIDNGWEVDYSRYDSDEIKKSIVINRDKLEEARTAHARKRDKAGDHGTNVHELIETYINFLIENNNGEARLARYLVSEDESKQLPQFIEWAKDNDVKFLESEKRLYSEDMWLAGTVDFVCEIDGKKLVGDLKTGNTIQTTAFYQCAAYALMMEEQGEEFDGTIIVHLPKNKPLQEYRRYDIETDKDAFKGILTAYKADKTYKLN